MFVWQVLKHGLDKWLDFGREQLGKAPLGVHRSAAKRRGARELMAVASKSRTELKGTYLRRCFTFPCWF